MDLGLFLLLSLAIIVIPGPNVMVIVATSLSHGRKRGLQTVAGTSLAMLVQLLIAGVGTGLFVNALTQGLAWLKWGGVGYLLYLGLGNLLRKSAETGALTATTSFQRGLWISLTNPKTILFFSAYLPQFVTAESSYFWQITTLSLAFWLLAVMFDSLYSLLSAWLGYRLQNYFHHSLCRRRLNGLVYMIAGAALANSARH